MNPYPTFQVSCLKPPKKCMPKLGISTSLVLVTSIHTQKERSDMPLKGTDIIQDDSTKPLTNPPTSAAKTRTNERQTINSPTLPAKRREPPLRGGSRGQHYDPDYNRNRHNNNNRNGDQGGRGGPLGTGNQNDGNGNRFND
ncbi:hypothetical protein PSTT_06495 [Puccinia striiformis]|uniref:Uncharacterized protein n=2 Tax=Puccinia striiformis TaxID=27350 RepID=A0A2S4VJY8_9BASI|nr:hypothetical protein PSTT_06495 [Puccinia striiformis]